MTDLGCAEHMYRFTEALTVWSHPFWEEWAIDDLDQYVETVEASPIKLGIEADYVARSRREARSDACRAALRLRGRFGPLHRR